MYDEVRHGREVDRGADSSDPGVALGGGERGDSPGSVRTPAGVRTLPGESPRSPPPRATPGSEESAPRSTSRPCLTSSYIVYGVYGANRDCQADRWILSFQCARNRCAPQSFSQNVSVRQHFSTPRKTWRMQS